MARPVPAATNKLIDDAEIAALKRDSGLWTLRCATGRDSRGHRPQRFADPISAAERTVRSALEPQKGWEANQPAQL